MAAASSRGSGHEIEQGKREVGSHGHSEDDMLVGVLYGCSEMPNLGDEDRWLWGQSGSRVSSRGGSLPN